MRLRCNGLIRVIVHSRQAALGTWDQNWDQNWDRTLDGQVSSTLALDHLGRKLGPELGPQGRNQPRSWDFAEHGMEPVSGEDLIHDLTRDLTPHPTRVLVPTSLSTAVAAVADTA